jgi:hypothetical protein
MITPPYLERALFVIGEPNSGKSVQLRSMFLDVRLATAGLIPRVRRLEAIYRLSNERCLYLRFTSPHEMNEFIGRKPSGIPNSKDFFAKTSNLIANHAPSSRGRWNFAAALQPDRRNNMPDAETTCQAFIQHFHPERTRMVILSPDRRGEPFPLRRYTQLVDRLVQVPGVEICCIDARHREFNGLFLADFFDFS